MSHDALRSIAFPVAAAIVACRPPEPSTSVHDGGTSIDASRALDATARVPDATFDAFTDDGAPREVEHGLDASIARPRERPDPFVGLGPSVIEALRHSPMWDEQSPYNQGRIGENRHPPPGRVVILRPTVRGTLGAARIERVLARHRAEMSFCYDRGLSEVPTLTGQVQVRFVIGATGNVIASMLDESTLASPTVEQCIVAAVRRWEFPQPTDIGISIVRMPLRLAPR